MEMGRLEFARPREAWGGEAVSFTPLLAQPELLEYLGRETDIGPLRLVEVEYGTAGHRSLDILAETIDGRRVAIENQYGIGDHDHLTRGLAYAVATESKALVVIAEDHRDEFVSVANYLNSLSGPENDSGISVWLVRVRAVRRFGDNIWSPEFVVQCQPNEWEIAIRQGTAPPLGSLDAFYQACSERTDPGWATTAQTIIEEWLSRPGAKERHDTKMTVSLFYPSPRHGPVGTNIAQLDTAGDFRVCRLNIWRRSGAFDQVTSPIELDNQIRECFPNAYWPEKGGFPKEPNAEAGQVRSFLDWLVQRFDDANARSGP